jgi:bifunctional N-acetylglucosamine-1-phosphate-uridyltransferase/glucosamine-1-phosphate-acetyltransferase GlmU-like protein
VAYSARPVAVIVLAAGEGTRMKSASPKVLHGFAGRTLLGHVLAAAAPLDAARTVVVIGHGRDAVREHLAAIAPDAVPVVQAEQHGTGHAVRIALDAVPPDAAGTVVVVPADAPLLTAATLHALVAAHDGAAATVLSSVADDPTGYGRVVRAGDAVTKIVEERDATGEERAINEVAASVYAFDHALLREAISKLTTDNAQGEEYLPDVERAVCRQARIGADVTIGPFAYLRPGTVLHDGVHVGTYVEVKGSEVGAGSKVPHLSYVGDATIGEQSNVGAATVFVNYDGVSKRRSTVGDHVRIGSDSMIVAPVEIGDGAYTAAGAVVVNDVPPGALARSSARQENVPGWVIRKRPGTAAAQAAERAEGGDQA